MTIGKRPFHDFCFINLMTPDLEPAAAFFGELFGWTYGDGVPGGKLILVGGRAAGALMDLHAPGMPSDMRPVVGVMIKVADVDATAARVVELGGRAHPPFDVLANGRMAVCFDPTGAAFDIWQPKSKDGAEHDSHAHGGPGWFEVMTTDAPSAVTFYERLFGWTPNAQPAMPGVEYTVFELDGRPIAGAMTILPHMNLGDTPPHWAVTFSVQSADDTARLAEKLGARVSFEPADIPGVGRVASLISPQGVLFSVLAWLAM